MDLERIQKERTERIRNEELSILDSELLIKEYIEKQGLTSVENMQNETKIALIEETGEILGVIKKIQFHKHRDREELKNKLSEEIGDYIWYLVQFAKETDTLVELIDVLENKIIRNSSSVGTISEKSLLNYSVRLMKANIYLITSFYSFEEARIIYDDIMFLILRINDNYDGHFIQNILKNNLEKLEKRYKDRIEKNN